MVTNFSEALVGYLEGLKLTGGDRDGELFTVLPWERRFIRGAFSTDRDSALSVGRANGKSAIVAGLACAVLDPAGPLHGRRREVVVSASSFQQGRVIFEDARGFLGERYDLRDREVWRVQDSSNVAIIDHRPSGARIRCIGSDPRRAHGLRPFLALMDEPAQHPPSTTLKFLAAIRTGLGKVPGSRLIALGTRPATSGHWFSKMLAGGAGYAQVHAARPDDPPFHLRTIRRANPSYDHLPTLRARLAIEAAEAKRDPDLLAAWRALRLNGGVGDIEEQVLIDPELWRSIEGEAATDGGCVWGVDLGTSAAQSAVVAYWPQTGALRCVAAFPSIPTLAERGLRDGVGRLYEECARLGELLTLGQRAVSVADLMRAALELFGRPQAVSADRWRESELRDALDAAGVPAAAFVSRGQGFKDGGEDVRTFRKSCATGAVTPLPSKLLRSAMAEARTLTDPAGNAKLAKASEGGRRMRARDDAAAAAILAVAVGFRKEHRTRGRGRRSAIVR